MTKKERDALLLKALAHSASADANVHRAQAWGTGWRLVLEAAADSLGKARNCIEEIVLAEEAERRSALHQ